MLKGGIREWKEKGFPVVAAPEAPSKAANGPNLYKQHCATCHGDAGEGHPPHFPPLADDPMMKNHSAWPAIYVTLEGLAGRPLQGKVYQGAMAPFKKTLTDEEIAALLTYARLKYGHQARPVLAKDVLRVRREVSQDRWRPQPLWDSPTPTKKR